jgi:hypothetical protein
MLAMNEIIDLTFFVMTNHMPFNVIGSKSFLGQQWALFSAK